MVIDSQRNSEAFKPRDQVGVKTKRVIELFCTTENPIFPENSVSFPENLF